MNDLVEKVARAICLSDGDDPDRLWNVEHPELRWLIYRENAQSAIVAVLDAIAEPSEAMQLAGHSVRNDPVTGIPTSCGTDEIYRAMIAALRREVGNE